MKSKLYVSVGLAFISLLLVPAIARAQQTVFTPNCFGTNDTAAFQSIIDGDVGNPRTIQIPYKSDLTKHCRITTLTVPSHITLDNTNGSGIHVVTYIAVAGPRVNPVGKAMFFGGGTVTLTGRAYDSLADATNSGIAKLSVAPASATNSIAVGHNDVRGVDSADYASLSAAVTAIGATPTDLVITNAFPSGPSTIVPATLRLSFTRAGSIVLGAGRTVTIRSGSSLWPATQQIFSGTGTVSFLGSTSIDTAHPEWWGAKADSADHTTAIRAALAAVDEINGTLEFRGVGKYTVSGAASPIFSFRNPIKIKGQGMLRTYIELARGTATTVDIFRYRPDGSSVQTTGFEFTDLGIFPAYNPYAVGWDGVLAGRHALVLDPSVGGGVSIARFKISRCAFGAFSGYGIFVNNASGGTWANPDGVFLGLIEENYIFSGINLDFAGDTITVRHNTFTLRNGVVINLIGPVGATTLLFTENSVTAPLPLQIYGGEQIIVSGNIFERIAAGGGISGAMVYVTGAQIQNVNFENNVFNSKLLATLDGVRLVDNIRNVRFEGNVFETPAGTAGVRIVGTNIKGTWFNFHTNPQIGLGSQIVNTSDVNMGGPVKALDGPASTRSGTATFTGAATKAVTFIIAEPTNNYRVYLDTSVNENFWVTNKTTTGFTINSSNATSTATIGWIMFAVR